MAEKRRDSDLSSELYFSVYGNNRKLPPQKIKVYALYKPLLENITANNFVVAANETNEIFISFKEGSESKLFNFDKVFYSDISQDDFYLLNKSAVQDVIMGVNSFLILCKLSPPPASSEVKSSFKMDFPLNIIVNVLKELLFFINKDENKACSLHVSYFEMHDNKLLDLLSKFKESKEIQIYENPEKENVEIKGLVEKLVVSDKDIDELFTRKLFSPECNATCCHSIIIISLVKRNISTDGFEFIKNGKLTLVSPAECKNFETRRPNTDDCLMNLTEKDKSPANSKSMILNILRPAFEGKVTTTVIIFLSSVLCSLKKDLEILQFSSNIRNVFTHPEMDLQLIIRNSTKEYADEIKELQKDLDATSVGNGVRIDHLLYRSINNTLALENEKVKNLSSQVFGLTDTINSKKEEIINLQKTLELYETEINEIETSSKNLKIGLEEIENKNITQKISLKADEIINVKKMIVSDQQYIKNLRLQLKENNRNYEELVRSIHFLKNETLSFVCDIDAQTTSQKSSLELLIVAMNNTFSEFQHLEKDLRLKFNNMLDIDVLIRSWKNHIENLMSSFSSLIQKNHERFTSMKLEITNSAVFHCVSRDAAVDIKCSLNGKMAAFLEYYLSKLQVFCDYSFKLLAEIIHQMDVIENYYKAEFKNVAAAFSSTNEAFKKFICDINLALKSFQQYFAEQEELSRMTEVISFHQKFKKQFGDKINDIKKSLLDLRQIYLNYNDASSSKWNQIKKGYQKTIQKHNDLSDHLTQLQKKIWPQQKINTLEYSSLKEKTDIENHVLQLLQIQKEMKGNLEEAFADHKKGTSEQFLEMKKYVNCRKTEIEKHFSVLSVKLKTSTSSFLDDLRNVHKDSSDIEDIFKRDLDSLSSVSLFEPIYDNYLSTSSSVLAKSEQSLKVVPSLTEDKKDSISDFENLFLEEWKVTTSTPNLPKTKKFSISEEKEKLLSRMKSLAEQQTFQKSNISVLDYEEQETKNVSTVSLPVLRTHSKVLLLSEKSFPRLKSRKK